MSGHAGHKAGDRGKPVLARLPYRGAAPIFTGSAPRFRARAPPRRPCPPPESAGVAARLRVAASHTAQRRKRRPLTPVRWLPSVCSAAPVPLDLSALRATARVRRGSVEEQRRLMAAPLRAPGRWVPGGGHCRKAAASDAPLRSHWKRVWPAGSLPAAAAEHSAAAPAPRRHRTMEPLRRREKQPAAHIHSEGGGSIRR